MEHLGSHGAEFHEILFLSNFRKSVEKFEVSLKSDNHNSSVREHRLIDINDNFSFPVALRPYADQGLL